MLQKTSANPGAAPATSRTEAQPKNRSLFFFRQLAGDKAALHGASADYGYRKQMGGRAKNFLFLLFKEDNFDAAQEACRRLIDASRESEYVAAVEFVDESFNKYQAGRGLPQGKRAKERLLPDIGLLALMHMTERNIANGAKTKALVRNFEWVISRAMGIGRASGNIALKWMERMAGSSPTDAMLEALRRAAGILESYFSQKLYLAAGQEDIKSACWYARKANTVAGKVGEAQYGAMADRIDSACEAFCDSRRLREIGLEPDEARGIFENEIPELRFYSKNHIYFANMRHEIDLAMMQGNYTLALHLSDEALNKAELIGSGALAYEFRMEALHCRLHECLFKKERNAFFGAAKKILPEGIAMRLFKPENLPQAIEVTKEILSLARKNNAPLPTFVLECFFIFGYSKNRASSLQPGQVRRAVLRAIPDFPSNHKAEMERLEIECRQKLDAVLMNGDRGGLAGPVGIATKMIELSYLSPTQVYAAKRRAVRTLFDNFAASYGKLHGEKAAKDDNYVLQKVREALSSNVPDLFFAQPDLEADDAPVQATI